MLLDFWFTSCGPCKEDAPQLKAIHRAHGDSLVVIGLSIDQRREDVRECIERESIGWEQVLDVADNTGAVNELYGVAYYPTYFLWGPSGKVVKMRHKLPGDHRG